MCNTQQNQFYVIYVIGIRSALLVIIGQADQLFGYEMCTWVGWNDKQKKTIANALSSWCLAIGEYFLHQEKYIEENKYLLQSPFSSAQ